MASAKCILSFGSDSHLLSTRVWVLQSCGYRVKSASSLRELLAMFKAERVDLLVLCHTLPAMVCQEAQQLAAAQAPPVPCLVLIAGSSLCSIAPTVSTVTTTEGPPKLLSAVARLVGNQAHDPAADGMEGDHLPRGKKAASAGSKMRRDMALLRERMAAPKFSLTSALSRPRTSNL